MKTGERFGLTGFTLKWIAILSMLIDHVQKVFFRHAAGIFVKIPGRLAFPIFCYLLVEGFHHTKDVRKYRGRLFLFALLSEVPFDLALYGKAFVPQSQNVFFTLFLGMWMMCILEKYKHAYDIYKIAIYLLIGGISIVLRTDYSFMGITMIFLFYWFRYEEAKRNIFIVILNISSGIPQCFGALALVPINLYNGARGLWMKYFFYLFYPGHLLILYLLTLLS